MSDASQHLRVQGKLKELIERASSAADANLHRKRRPYPLGFAVRAKGSKFAFRPEGVEDNDTAVAHIRTLFQQNNVVCYVLTFAAVSKGKQLVLFTAEDEFGLMVGRREIIMQPAPHLGPLEIIDSDFAEGRFVGLLPHQEPSLARRSVLKATKSTARPTTRRLASRSCARFDSIIGPPPPRCSFAAVHPFSVNQNCYIVLLCFRG